MKQPTQGREYISAHVSQAKAKLQQLQASGVTVEAWRQSGDTVYFRTAQPAPTPPHRRQTRWLLWIVGAVVALFGVAAALNAGILAAGVGASMAGVLLFGALALLAWKASNGRGFVGTTIGGLVLAVLAIGALSSVEPMWNADAAQRQAAIIAQCAAGDVDCRVAAVQSSWQRLIEVANSPASEGMGLAVLAWVVATVGGGWVLWRATASTKRGNR